MRYKVGGCTSEVTDVTADGIPTRTIAIESEDAAAVVAAVKAIGLWDYVNTSYGKGLTAALEQRAPRYAVIDVGTNSVKFHVGERQADGTLETHRRPGRGVATGRRRATHPTDPTEPLRRTANAVKDMVDEARREGALAIAPWARPSFRIASNGAAAVAAIKPCVAWTLR